MCLDRRFKWVVCPLLFLPEIDRYKGRALHGKKNPPKVYSAFEGYVIMFGFVYFFFPYFLEI